MKLRFTHFSSLFVLLTGIYSTSCSENKNIVSKDISSIDISKGYLNNSKWNLPLITEGQNGSKITWSSDNKEYISDDGTLLKFSPRTGEKVKVNLTATISSGSYNECKTFEVSPAFEEPEYKGYLFAYFEGSGERNKQEQLRFGVSQDAVNWYALNNNEPIIASDTISQTGGIRDPYIMRCEDEKTFYMVATDMFTMKDGWGYNPGLILMRSENLVDWTHSKINISELYPEKFANLQWVWAPQVIFDPQENKYLVYFTLRFKGEEYLDFYCAYANEDFSAFINEPEMMFRAKYGAIDGDIIYKEGLYHFFFKANTKDENGKEYKNGIQQATAKSLMGPWEEDFKYLDAYADSKIVVEGSSIFKLNNSDTFILMYDLYSSLRYEFQRSNDLINFTSTPESFTKNFNPRHGSIISITHDEAERLNKKWCGTPQSLLD